MDALEIADWHNIVILTGAGISAESGLSTFRGADGLWENHRVEEVATPEAFARDPAMVYRFYNARRQQLMNVSPNAAHRALAELERCWSSQITLISQNVDDLHQRAGSKALLSMHGELAKMRCKSTERVHDAPVNFDGADLCPCCQLPGNLRPHVVWFGEMPLHMDEITLRLADCDAFIAIGTSATVYPAAGFVSLAQAAGAVTLEINPEPTSASSQFDHHWRGPATEQVPRLVAALLGPHR
ncbi:MAG: NAD-dependent deacylase [Pseudomonadota bacterium]